MFTYLLLYLWARRENTTWTTVWVDGLLQVWPWVYCGIRAWTYGPVFVAGLLHFWIYSWTIAWIKKLLHG